MSGPAQTITLRQARSWLRKRMPALQQMTTELTALLEKVADAKLRCRWAVKSRAMGQRGENQNQ